MKKLIFSLFVAFIATIALWASNVITYTATEKLTSMTLEVGATTFGSAITSHTYNDGTGTITCEREVTTIGEQAFAWCSGLTSVTIPNSVTTIGDWAFFGCSGLTSIEIPNSVTTIGEDAFYNVNNIVYNGIATGSPWGAKSVNGYVDGYLVYSDASKTTLCGCSSAATGEIIIPNSVTTIGDFAFFDCSGLTSVTIPNSVTTIGESAFDCCRGLTKTNYTGTIAQWCKIEFENYSSNPIYYSHNFFINDVEVKDLVIPNSITEIGDYVFCVCYGLTSVTIPNSVTTIGSYAFNYCSGLTSVTIPNSVITIGGGAFSGCSRLTSITIPNSVTTIGNSAFYQCSGLTSVTIPNSVTTIGDEAFYNCSGLTSVTIPNSVTSIGGGAFRNVNNIVYNGTATWESYDKYWGAKCVNGYVDGYLVYSDASKTTLCGCSTAAIGEITIPNSVTTIGEWAFAWCSGLTSITIPNSVTTIGSYAFLGCYGLTSVTIPNSVTTIGNSAFYQCSGLTSVTIPNSVTTIGDWAFFGCSGLTSIEIPNSVTTIGEDAFAYCSGMTSVTIPNSVTTIGNSAFFGCSGLTSITIPNSVTTIGRQAFAYCSGLTSITIGNSVTTIGESAFEGCSGLTSITCYAQDPPICGGSCFSGIPQNIPVYIPFNASLSAYKSAAGWKEFTNIIKPFYGVCGEDLHWKYKDGTLSISGRGDMYDFTQTDSPWLDLKDSVTNIVFPSNITSIGNYAFYDFSKLTSIAIPHSVTAIGESAFENCTYLKTITLGKSLTDIGCNAFKGDFRVEEITSYAEVTPNVCSSTFNGLSKQYIYLYVPENSIRGYQVDPNWNGFDIRTKSADKKPIDGENPVVTPTDQDVTITWPITDGTDTYTLTITKNGEVVCVLTFNANGQLTNIAFAAPGRNGAHQAPAATLTAQGYQFTVTGLNPGTAYDYSVTATDAGGKTLAEHKGNFSTTGGGTPTPINKVHGSQGTMHKFFHNGNLIIERNGVKYTATGQKVR